MTKVGLEYDRKKFTPTNVTKKSHRRTLTVGLDQKPDEHDRKSINEINSLRR